MPRTLFAALLVLSLALPVSARAADGLTAIKSPHPVKETIDRLEAAAKARNLIIFVRVDHAAGAQKVGRAIRATELLIFGNPQGGTPFIECAQSVGIDLPLKALAWQDAAGQVWLGYNEPQFIAARHGVTQCAVVPNLKKALEGLAAEATKP
jgi:uncharacterized protein (DUF302 family)